MKICGWIKSLVGRGLIFAAVITGVALGMPAYAADDETPAYRIQISPAKLNIDELEPGKTYIEKFAVQNTGSEAFNFSLSVAPFSVTDENYGANFTAESQYTQIAGWIDLSTDSGHLEPNSSQDITVTIVVPKDVPAGGQYGAILATLEKTNNEEANIQVTQQVGLVLYTNVAGTTRNGGSVVENKISGFLFEPPISGTSLIENTGNTHIEAEYILQVFPLFSSEEVYTNEEHPETRTVLPETRRFNTISWDGAPKLGIFKVKQTIKILGETSVTEKLVFLCPIWFLFIIILLVFCVVFWLVGRARNRNRAE